MKTYETFEEWKKDMDFFNENPNDFKFLKHMANRVRISDKKIQTMIKEEIADEFFEKDPYKYMLFLSRQYENKIPVMNSKNNIWFEV